MFKINVVLLEGKQIVNVWKHAGRSSEWYGSCFYGMRSGVCFHSGGTGSLRAAVWVNESLHVCLRGQSWRHGGSKVQNNISESMNDVSFFPKWHTVCVLDLRATVLWLPAILILFCWFLSDSNDELWRCTDSSVLYRWYWLWRYSVQVKGHECYFRPKSAKITPIN